MAFFGVELNAQINKLVYNIKLTLAKNKYNPNFRTIYRSFIKYDPEQTGYVNSTHFEKVVIILKIRLWERTEFSSRSSSTKCSRRPLGTRRIFIGFR